MACGTQWCYCTESYVDKGLQEEVSRDAVHSVWDHSTQPQLTQRTACTPRSTAELGAPRSPRSSALTRQSSESLNLVDIFAELGPSGECSPNEEELLQENWLGTARKRGSQERLGLLSTGLWRWMRRKVAGSRCRYVSNGFDLDLAYVTSKIIAMGFPGKSSGACFRNPQSEVQRFLRWAHGDGCFRIYNLCAERSFRENGFPDETIHFPCADHCPPQFSKILEFCRDVEAWLKVDERNVAAIHCKAGKGRSGTMICALLLYAGAVLSARDALRWFGHVRGGTRAGVTIPSQIRWIAMFETWLEQGVQLLSDPMGPSTGRYRPCAIQFSHLGLEGPVKVKVALVSRQDGIPQAVHRLYLQLSTCNDLLHFTAPWWNEADGMMSLTLEVSRRTWHAGLLNRKLRMKAWWHHAFLERQMVDDRRILLLDLPKACVDGLQRDAGRHALTPADFRITIHFEDE
ncbi:4 [Durusdinium trenchii]|uniref:4 n=1 Tax=Durusdinium trenchii TaxID=1381693 RepID=A0ABP0LG75_9DINO